MAQRGDASGLGGSITEPRGFSMASALAAVNESVWSMPACMWMSSPGLALRKSWDRGERQQARGNPTDAAQS
jgi:hypothetical protein